MRHCVPSRWHRAWAVGADLFAACDERVAAESATFRFPGSQFGILLGTRRLAERIGTDRARRLVLEAGEPDAVQAMAAGPASAIGVDATLADLPVDRDTERQVRRATRPDQRDADLAALVRSAAAPGLQQRIGLCRERMLEQRSGGRPTRRSLSS